MKLDKTITVLRSLKVRLLDMYDAAKTYSITAEQLKEQRLRFYDDQDFRSLPRWAHSELRGYENALRDMQWKNDLATVYVWVHSGIPVKRGLRSDEMNDRDLNYHYKQGEVRMHTVWRHTGKVFITGGVRTKKGVE